MCQSGKYIFSLIPSIVVRLDLDDFAKSSAKKEKAQPKNRLPNSISYRRSCSHFNYYLIPRDEHVATRPVSLPPGELRPQDLCRRARTEPTYTHKNPLARRRRLGAHVLIRSYCKPVHAQIRAREKDGANHVWIYPHIHQIKTLTHKNIESEKICWCFKDFSISESCKTGDLELFHDKREYQDIETEYIYKIVPNRRYRIF
ncbi:unnamed protein product [Colias eurytheme]|nr:unnamed protein product [Colias eurytheme]